MCGSDGDNSRGQTTRRWNPHPAVFESAEVDDRQVSAVTYDRSRPRESQGPRVHHSDDAHDPKRPTAVELFAGVGGFHLALGAAGFDVIASNQWEPSTKAQHAVTCLVDNIEKGRLPAHEILPYDIEHVLNEVENRHRYLPQFDLLV